MTEPSSRSSRSDEGMPSAGDIRLALGEMNAAEMRVAVAAVRWMLSRAVRSEQGTRWIPVGERKPEPYETVLLNCDGELRSTGYMKSNLAFSVDAEDPSDGSRWIVTHWQPLPECPKSNDKDRSEK